ncbi:hypothetical protein ACFOLJ_07455 [Rugamonas sp. CCM 8940]|uniref:hypothetical protein n=1 Tax=Rugamonas sp. CCM 8940 TaxID=2765359 RepID=UPI0018F4A98E|nr:hypothetical protein [Rugamonas sp. CCM 8940]MBJ7310212.1 hypothetical protein [Rugamonas sp. CCM 8940]
MTLKLALFVFALGLGGASAYAASPLNECYWNCNEAYRACVGKLETPEPNERCEELRWNCYGGCEGL